MEKDINDITWAIIGESIKIHKELGPGLLESVYEEVLSLRLKRRGFRVRRQDRVSIVFEGETMPKAFRSDLIVEDRVIVEIKSFSYVPAVDYRRLVTYLRLTKMEIGLLINFNVTRLKDGIKRFANYY